MRTKGYKCYNIKCGACVGKTLCGLYGDEALTCVDRMVNQKTNADRIRSLSDEELAELFMNTFHATSEIIPFCAFNEECDRLLGTKDGIPYSMCMSCMVKWLQQPYISEDIKSSEYIEKDIENVAKE